MTAASRKATALTLRVAVIVFAIIGVLLLEVGWLYPQQIAVRYPTGKHLFWELMIHRHKGYIWECLLLCLKEEEKGSSYTVSSGGQGWSFAKDHADCSVLFYVRPLNEKVATPDEAMVKRLAERIDRMWKQASMESEIKPYENGYEIRFSFTVTDNDYLQALNKEAGKGD